MIQIQEEIEKQKISGQVDFCITSFFAFIPDKFWLTQPLHYF